MSKSLGNVIEPVPGRRLYGADALRFYVLREVSFGADGEVSPEGFETRYTTELANEYGNLASRTLAMIERYRDGVVPDAEPAPALGRRLRRPRRRGRADASTRVELTAALDEIWRRDQAAQPVRAGRGAVEAREGRRRGRPPRPGALHARRGPPRGLGAAARRSCPDSAERLLAALGREDLSLDGATLGAAGGGANVGELGQLFPRVEAEATRRLRPSR